MYLCFKDGEDHLYPWVFFFWVALFWLWLRGRAETRGCMNCAAPFCFLLKKIPLFSSLWGWFGMMPDYLVSWDVGMWLCRGQNQTNLRKKLCLCEYMYIIGRIIGTKTYVAGRGVLLHNTNTKESWDWVGFGN